MAALASVSFRVEPEKKPSNVPSVPQVFAWGSTTEGAPFSRMSQTIYKMAGRKDPFARIPHTLLEDERLSWQAKGLLCYLVGKPDGWKVRVADLVKRGADGERAVRNTLKELRVAGYGELVCVRDEAGRVQEWVWKVSDTSIFTPDGCFPHVDKPLVEKGHHSKKQPIKKDCSKKESKEAEETPLRGAAVSDSASEEYQAEWKPSPLSKAQQLRRIRPPKDYPSQEDFESFLESEDLENVLTYRPDLYAELCAQKWHTWKEHANRWARILDWQKFAAGLNAKIDAASGF